MSKKISPLVSSTDVVKKFCPYDRLYHLVEVKKNVYRTNERVKKEVMKEYEC
jgi:hypothetical protein